MNIRKRNHSASIATAIVMLMGLGGNSADVAQSNNLRQSEERVKSGGHQLFGEPGRAKTPPGREVDQNPDLSVELGKIPDQKGLAFHIDKVEVVGDVEFIKSIPSAKENTKSLYDQLWNDCIGKSFSIQDIKDLCIRYTKEFIKHQHYLAYMVPVRKSYADGKLVLKIRPGRFGKTRFFDRDRKNWDTGKHLPFKGRYYSENQLREKFTFEEYDPFDYKVFYRDVLSINNHPDLNLDSNLRLVTDRKTNEKVVDLDFIVAEEVPFHGAFRIDNTGTEDTDEWRYRATVQHLNLTKNFDVLTLEFASAFDGEVNSGAGSYSRPLSLLPRSSITVFGGVSDLDTDNITTGLDNEGEGWFAGVQLRLGFLTIPCGNFDFSIGLTQRSEESELLTQAPAVTVRENSIKMTPLTFGVNFTQTKQDSLGGRNFLSANVSINKDGWFGSDSDKDFAASRVGADPDYYVSRFHASRLQRLFSRKGKWLLYLKLDGQWAADPLLSSEQMAIGGMNSVRGYEEREVLGDKGISATVELRTPIIDRGFMSKSLSTLKPAESLQFIVYSDYGYVRRLDALVDEEDSVGMISVGVGVRLGLTEHLQVRFDYGVPLEATVDTETSDGGRAHLVVQVQF